jgi:putative peptidoglycan lipid II flippase
MAILRTALPRGALILSTVTLVSFAMGLLETKVLSHVFGAGTDTDAFNAAFVLPSLALDVLVVGGLIASFVPLYVELKDQDARDALAFGRTVFTLAVLAVAVVVGLMMVFAPQCVSFVAPGFAGNQRSEAIDMFRILGVTQIVFAATWVLGEVLIAEKRWLAYAVAPIFYSGGIILGSLLLGDAIGIYGAALGAVGGSLVYLGIRLYGAVRAGFLPAPRFDLRTKGLRRYFILMLPKMISQPLESSIILLYFTALASTLQVGSVTDLSYARKFQTMPELVIGAQFAIAAFPALSAAVEQGNRRAFRKILGTNLATIAVLSTVAALGLLTLGWLAVRIVLAGGEFTEQDVRTTTLLVAVFAISIPLESMVELLARGMYATKNTLIPTAASVVSFLALFVTAQALAPAAGLVAIPAAYGVGMGVKLVILAFALAPRMEAIGRVRPPLAAGWFAPQARPMPAPAAGSYSREPWPSPIAAARPYQRGAMNRTPRFALGVLVAVCLTVAGLFTANQALQGATFGFGPPIVTPRPRPAETLNVATAAPSEIAAVSPTASSGPSDPPSPTPTASFATPAASGQFAMDLYKPGAFVGEFKDTWCVPAAIQTMMNIMDPRSDVTEATQSYLFDLGNSIAESRNGSPDPEGLSGALEKGGYGNYVIQAKPTMAAAVKAVVKQIRITNRPAALFVWKGWHTWVVSGFVATADPAATDNYNVKALSIEDVWYNRHSSLWNPTRGGYSRPPDSLVPVAELPQDFLKWNQSVYYAGKQNQWVYAVPVP